MGLLDILNGLGGASGTPTPQSSPASQSMSPMAKALLALLAVYAAKHVSFQPGGSAQPAPQPRMNPPPPAPGGGLGGGLGDILKGPLGGILGGTVGGAAAGGALSGGLGGLLKQLQQGGLAGAAHSWVGTGANQEVDEEDLSKALGADTINQVSAHSGLSRSDLLSQLSQNLPGFIDKLTPNGRLPTEQEAEHW